jgi:hypothetical protein
MVLFVASPCPASGDSTFPGVAALVISMGLQPLVDPARTYLEGYILSKWAVSWKADPATSVWQHGRAGLCDSGAGQTVAAALRLCRG